MAYASPPASAPTVKQPVLSYADSAKRGTSVSGIVSSRSRSTASNSNNEVLAASTGSNSPVSVQNITPGSSSIPTRSGSPPTSPSQTSSADVAPNDRELVPALPLPSKPPPPSVWVVRAAKRVASAGPQPPHPSPLPQAENVPSSTLHRSSQPNGKSMSHARPPLNGISNSNHAAIQSLSVNPDESISGPSSRAHGADLIVPATSLRIDDLESWPEVGKPVQSGSSHVASHSDKKDPVGAWTKKNEKPKKVLVPAAELQAVAEALTQQIQPPPRPHKQSNSRSINQSSSTQARSRNPPRNNLPSGSADNVDPSNNPQNHRSGSGDVSSVSQSRDGSNPNSRMSSVHSSPRYLGRGRRLHDEHSSDRARPSPLTSAPATNGTTVPASQAQHTDVHEAENGTVDVTSTPTIPQTVSESQDREVFSQQPAYPIPTTGYIDPPYSHHPQAPPGYTSHSPVYYPPPHATSVYNNGSCSPMPNVYSHLPPNPNGVYHPQNMPPPHGHPHSYAPYPPPSSTFPQPPNHSTYPIYYPPSGVPYGYYAPGPSDRPGALYSYPQYENRDPQQQAFNPSGRVGQFDDALSGLSDERRSPKSAPKSPQLPPTSLLTRPPPPEQSNALAGYREIDVVPVSPFLNAANGTTGPVYLSSQKVPHVATKAESLLKPATHEAETMVFGSVGRPGGMKSPSPAPSPNTLLPQMSSLGLHFHNEEPISDGRKIITAYSIGVKPGEGGPSHKRSKRKAAKRAEGLQAPNSGSSHLKSPGMDSRSTSIGTESATQTTAKADGIEAFDVKVIDLTDHETKWEFGTSKRSEGETRSEGGPSTTDDGTNRIVSTESILQHPQPQLIQTYPHMPGPLLQHPGAYSMVAPMPLNLNPLIPPAQPSSPLPPLSAIGQPQPILGIGPISPGVNPLLSPLALGQPHTNSYMTHVVDEWEVRDYGYGFGNGGAERAREERMERERERERDYRDRDRDPGFSRRSSNASGYSGFSGGYEGRGGYERGGFGNRRARGTGGGGYGGRGFVPRGFAPRGGRGDGRLSNQSSFNINPPYQYQPQPSSHDSPTSQQPPSHSQANDASNGYFPASHVHYGQYIPSVVSQQQPIPSQPIGSTTNQPHLHPQPAPITTLSFPLDPTRWYLLGQLEYYFSIQNLVNDIYLRQQMDSQGWIPIPLVASFKRVRQLTMDVQLVKDVLMLSSLVEVFNDYVRLRNRQWEQFVLPTAPSSTVEDSSMGGGELLGSDNIGYESAIGGDLDADAEDEDDDDVVFVLNREESTPWSPRERSQSGEHTQNATRK